MDVEIKRVMETDADGVKRQIFPQTHVNAIIGLDEAGAIESPVSSVNGKTGNVSLKIDDLASSEMLSDLKEMLEAFKSGTLGSNIIFEPIEEETE